MPKSRRTVVNDPKTVKLGFTRVRGANRVMWYLERDKATPNFVQTLEQIGADAKVVDAAKR